MATYGDCEHEKPHNETPNAQCSMPNALKRGACMTTYDNSEHEKPHSEIPNAQCPMPNAFKRGACMTTYGDCEHEKPPNAQCPMPNAQCPLMTTPSMKRPTTRCPKLNAQCPMPNALSYIDSEPLRKSLLAMWTLMATGLPSAASALAWSMVSSILSLSVRRRPTPP